MKKFRQVKNFLFNNQIQRQSYLDLQTQQMYIDYKDVSDVLLSLLSTAEAISIKNDNEKVYGYYDEHSTAKTKGINSQKIQLLRLLREFYEMKNEFISKYKTYELPDNLTSNEIKEEIIYWKSLIKDDLKIPKYFDEIIWALKKTKPRIDIKYEISLLYDKNIKLSEEEKFKRWNNIVGIHHLCEKEDQDVIDEYQKTGKYEYKIKKNVKDGRFIKKSGKKNSCNYDNYV